MANKIIFSLLLTVLIGTNVEARSRSRSKWKNKSRVKVEDRKQEEEEVEPVNEKQENVDEDTQRIMDRNERMQPNRYVKSEDSSQEEDEKSEEEKKNEILEAKKMENDRLNKEVKAEKLLSQGVSGDELVGEEFIKWSTAKAKMSSKEFKRLYLENIKMKRILRRLHDKQTGVSPTNQQAATPEKQQEVKNHDEEIFYIYGNYEDEEGELAGDQYIKWSTLKAKVTSKQFRSLVKRNNFLQRRVQRLMGENRRLTSEVAELQLRNKRLLRG